MNLSYWEKETWLNRIDVVIVGSGIVGLNAAIHLKSISSNLKVLVLERGILPSGASTKNAGFSCFGSISELLDDLEKHSEDEVFSLVERRWEGLQKLRKNLGDEMLDYKSYGGFEVFRDSDKLLFETCADKLEYFNREIKKIIGSAPYSIVDEKIKGFGLTSVTHLIENSAEGQIHTGKMMDGLYRLAISKGVIVLNGVELKSFEEAGDSVVLQLSENIEVKCYKLLITNNGFAKQLLPDLDVQPARAQVLVTSPIAELKLQGAFHLDKGYYYFRNIDGRVLLGGGRNLDVKGETTFDFGITEPIQKSLEDILQNIILKDQKYKIEQRWSGIMGIGNKKTIINKQISANVFCAVRMGGMGVALGSLVGEEGAEMVAKEL